MTAILLQCVTLCLLHPNL
uniref:Uncharacterized protein n=1 Tax=Anguilla anguilla TaxID=7936 RepID=A0A0E9ULS9_ANGAN